PPPCPPPCPPPWPPCPAYPGAALVTRRNTSRPSSTSHGGLVPVASCVSCIALSLLSTPADSAVRRPCLFSPTHEHTPRVPACRDAPSLHRARSPLPAAQAPGSTP